MAIIGTFKKVGTGYEGEFMMLALQVKGVRIIAEGDRSKDDAPSHRVFVGRAEIGAGWTRKVPALSVNTTPKSALASRALCSSGTGSLCRTDARSYWSISRAST